MKTYYQKHREKMRAYQAAWRKAHPASRKRHRRDYYLRNCVALRAKARAYYWAHREARLAYATKRATNARPHGGREKGSHETETR